MLNVETFTAKDAYQIASDTPRRKLENALNWIYKYIQQEAKKGKYSWELELARVDTTMLEDYTYIFNHLKRAGYAIDDHRTYWIIKWKD